MSHNDRPSDDDPNPQNTSSADVFELLRTKIIKSSDALARLAELGIDYDELIGCRLAGYRQRCRCTPFHPVTFPGQCEWGEFVGCLRQKLADRDWRPLDLSNLPLIVRPDDGLALTVSTGDEATGLAGLTPRTKNPHGTVMRDLVKPWASPFRQLNIFTFDDEDDPTGEEEHEPLRLVRDFIVAPGITWVVLFSDGPDRLMTEVSLPRKLSDDGHVVSWEERILLAPIPLAARRNAA